MSQLKQAEAAGRSVDELTANGEGFAPVLSDGEPPQAAPEPEAPAAPVAEEIPADEPPTTGRRAKSD